MERYRTLAVLAAVVVGAVVGWLIGGGGAANSQAERPPAGPLGPTPPRWEAHDRRVGRAVLGLAAHGVPSAGTRPRHQHQLVRRQRYVVRPIPCHVTAQLFTATRARPTRRRQRPCRIPCHLGEEGSEGRAGRSWLPPSRPTTGPDGPSCQGARTAGLKSVPTLEATGMNAACITVAKLVVTQGPGVLSICPAGEVGPGGLGRYGADTGFRDHAVLTAS